MFPPGVGVGAQGPQPLALSSLILTRRSRANTFRDRGHVLCVYIPERERQQPRGRHLQGEGGYRRGDGGKDETLTQKQTAPSFNSQLRAV